jgi:hypothetical protein
MGSGDESLNGKAFSEAFLRENPGVRSVIELFEHFPFVLFYSKDAQQRYIAVNPRTLMDVFGCRTLGNSTGEPIATFNRRFSPMRITQRIVA